MAKPDDSERAPLPVTASRNFTTPEMKAVIQRAVELHAGNASGSDEGVSDAELVRIGQELGLDPATIRRAMAEVRSRPSEDQGVLVRLAGDRMVLVSRVIRRPAAGTMSQLDNYLRTTELMVAKRRFADRTRYESDSSLAANMSRIARGFSRGPKPLKFEEVDVAVSAIDAESCLVELSVDLGVMRNGLIAGVLGSSTVAASVWAAIVWGTAIVDPLMLVGLPVVAGAFVGTRAIYGSIRTTTQEKLETLLDRVEHDELD